MPSYKKQVFTVGLSKKTDKNGNHWMLITTEGKTPGTPKEENIFDAALKAKFSDGPGVYDLKYDKKENGFWNIVDATRIANLPGSNGHQAPAAQDTYGKKAPEGADAVLSKTDAIVIACAAAIAVIVAAEAGADLWKEDGVGGVPDHAALLMRVLLAEGRKPVIPQAAAAQPPATQPEPEEVPF